jgi:hypothetical protein
MRPAFLYYLAQTRTAEPHRQAQRDALARDATWARRTRTSRRWRRAHGLPAVAARHVLTALTRPGTGGGPPVQTRRRPPKNRSPAPQPYANPDDGRSS